MIDNDLLEIIKSSIFEGATSGVGIGLMIWLFSWGMSQIFHLFKALSK